MNEKLLFELITKNSRHIEIINHELGKLCSQVDWLTWAVRSLIIGVIVSVGLMVINIMLTSKNNKNVKNR